MHEEIRERVGRIAVAFAGGLVIIVAVLSMLGGELSFENYWGGLVFAPIAMLVGALALFVALFKWRNLTGDKSPGESKHDDWRKW